MKKIKVENVHQSYLGLFFFFTLLGDTKILYITI